jgi:Phosphotransferase system cellobiose-specific component IIA
MTEEQVDVSMSIIMHAGDARAFCKDAISSIAKGDLTKAKSLLNAAQKEIAEAHRVQTDVIQGETRGEKREYSLLFAHAQDTLMTVYSEINMSNQFIKVFESYETRLALMEERLNLLDKN